MYHIIFNYNEKEIKIQCKSNDIMKDIFQKYELKTNINNNNVFYLYNGLKVNKELTLEEIINSNDNGSKQLNILLYDITRESNQTLKESK